MDAFVSREKRKANDDGDSLVARAARAHDDEESTDLKLAILSSIYEDHTHEDLLEALLQHEGSVERAIDHLLGCGEDSTEPTRKKTSNSIAVQSALPFQHRGGLKRPRNEPGSISRPLTKKGRTLHLYTADSIAQNTPCSLVYPFLPSDLANALLQELLPETSSFTSATFKLFENVVQSPHTACFYVDSLAERERQQSEYLYNGSNLDDVREILPVMRRVSALVQETVNKEIEKRIRDFYPGGKKLKYQSPQQWKPNAAFVNCYDGAQQSVGYHSDQLTYLGPRAVIGSLSLGVEREFRVRRIVPRPEIDDKDGEDNNTAALKRAAAAADEAANQQGQIAIHLPHNSLLVMHAEMQESWKHAISPAQHITPHPIAGNKRVNITYRWYREEFEPKYTPKCHCGVPCVLKTVQRVKQNVGRYVWMCQTPGRVVQPEKVKVSEGKGDEQGCGYFEWAEFDEDGTPKAWTDQTATGQSMASNNASTRGVS